MRFQSAIAGTALLLSVTGLLAEEPSRHGYKLDFKRSDTFRGTTIYRQETNLAYAYETAAASADADGAPNAYHPDDIGKNCRKDEHYGLDCPANAGYPKTSWWAKVLVPDPHNPSKAYVQKDGPYIGFFVAATSLLDPNGDLHEFTTYVNATKVPYVVLPSGFEKLKDVAKQGDVGIATDLDSGKSTSFIVADSGGGSDAKLGEASMALFAALGYPKANPRNGSGLPKGSIQYILFPGSHRSGSAIWPRTNADIHDQVMTLVKGTPGIHPRMP